jgi:hypothetical protein
VRDLLNSQLSTVEKGLLFTIDPIIFSDIFVESPYCKLLLGFGEPSCGAGKIGDDENGNQRYKYLMVIRLVLVQ